MSYSAVFVLILRKTIQTYKTPVTSVCHGRNVSIRRNHRAAESRVADTLTRVSRKIFNDDCCSVFVLIKRSTGGVHCYKVRSRFKKRKKSKTSQCAGIQKKKKNVCIHTYVLEKRAFSLVLRVIMPFGVTSL